MADIRIAIDAQIAQLHKAGDVQEGSRQAGVTKEAAILGALVTQQSTETTAQAAQLMADALAHSAEATTRSAADITRALDANTQASNTTGRRLIFLTGAYVVLTFFLVINAWCAHAPRP
jgi:hypothetical protein